MLDSEFIAPYATSNVISIALLFSAFKRPNVTRILFILIFITAALFNAYTAFY